MDNLNANDSNWNQWAKYILLTLEELKNQNIASDAKIENNKDAFMQAVASLELTVTKEVGGLTAKMGVLETKLTQRSTVVGALAGFIPAAAAFIYMLFKLKVV